MEEILHQLIGSLSHYLQGFLHPRWCRISSINSRSVFQRELPLDSFEQLSPVYNFGPVMFLLYKHIINLIF